MIGRRARVASLATTVMAFAQVAHADDAGRTVTAQVEVAAEVDSNVTRVESGPSATAPAEVAAALRVGGRGTARGIRLGGGYGVSAAFTLRDVQDPALDAEDQLALAADGQWQWPLRERALALGVQATAYDVLALGEAVGARAFRALSGAGTMRLADEAGHQLTIAVGARDLIYKADDGDAWRGPSASARLGLPLWTSADDTRQIELEVTYRVDARRYRGLALMNVCLPGQPLGPTCAAPTDVRRSDVVHVAEAQATYTGPIVVEASYALTGDASNSFGQSLIRHRVTVAATWALPWALFATATATAQLDQYLDGLIVAADTAGQAYLTIEDDNRSSLQVRVARALGAGFTLEARLAGFRDLGGGADARFRRGLVALGVTWSR